MLGKTHFNSTLFYLTFQQLFNNLSYDNIGDWYNLLYP